MKVISFFILNLIFVIGYNQVLLSPNKKKNLLINNLQVPVRNSNQFISNEDVNRSQMYAINNDSIISLIHRASFFLTAKDTQENYYATGHHISPRGFFSGPIEFDSWSSETIALKYNRIWEIYRWQVKEFIQKFGQSNYTIPIDILEYPAHNHDGSHQYFPFRDVNNDGIYNALDGDYPEFNLDGTLDCDDPRLYGDQTLLWIVNDKGGPDNTHLNPLGFNVFCQAFAYQGSESINNASFYEFRIENQSVNTYDSTFFTIFLDADVICSDDDLIGSDVSRGLSYYSNTTSNGFSNPCFLPSMTFPAIGLDFIKGPLANLNDGIDNNYNGIIDEPNERLAMSSFFLASPMNPLNSAGDANFYLSNARDFNGNKLMHPDGYNFTFMCPDSSDNQHWFSTNGFVPNQYWVDSQPSDKRTLHNIGSMYMPSHESKSIIVAFPYALDSSNIRVESVKKLKLADDTLQMLADNCFNLDCQPFFDDFFITQHNDNTFHFAYAQDADSYVWDFGDGNTFNGNFPVHSFSAPGDYTVCVTVNSVCDNQTFCKEVEVSTNMLNLTTVDVMRIEGLGNGGNELRIKQSSIDEMFNLDADRMLHPVYEGKYAPIKIEILDHSQLIPGDYQVAFDGVDSLSNWKIYPIGGTDTVYSNQTLKYAERQIIPQWGISVTVRYSEYKNGVLPNLIAQSKITEAPYVDWLTGVENKDIANNQNWIAAGNSDISTSLDPVLATFNDYIGKDNDEVYETIFEGTMAPIGLMRFKQGQVFQNNNGNSIVNSSVSNRPVSFQLVYTKDTTKWTRCPVLETSFDPNSNPYGDEYLALKSAPSVNKNGQPDGTGTGMGWFPGYAIDLESGERLNMAFGDASDLIMEGGGDMIFNPKTSLYSSNGIELFGGKHYVFVFKNYAKEVNFSQAPNHIPYYDKGQKLFDLLNSSNNTDKLMAWRACSWVQLPMTKPNHQFLSNDITLRVNTSTPYGKYAFNYSDTLNNTNPLYQFHLDFDVSVEENISEIEHSLYPNPSNGMYFMEIDVQADEKYQMIIFNAQGQIIKTHQITQERFNFDLSNESNGLYFYYIHNDSGKQFAKGTLVKQ